jgi:CheY-like chemotaxis protein
VVDDSVSVRRATELLMRDAGYDVATARDGLEALALFERVRPAVALVDLEMPRMNGLDLTRALRSDPKTAGLPIVMITSRFTQRHRDIAQVAGVSAFLTKPFSEELLLGTVTQLLAQNTTPTE